MSNDTKRRIGYGFAIFIILAFVFGPVRENTEAAASTTAQEQFNREVLRHLDRIADALEKIEKKMPRK